MAYVVAALGGVLGYGLVTAPGCTTAPINESPESKALRPLYELESKAVLVIGNLNTLRRTGAIDGPTWDDTILPVINEVDLALDAVGQLADGESDIQIRDVLTIALARLEAWAVQYNEEDSE
ncbi:MAG: hypothetical protein CMJ75_18580 [Planctomycetaceae bacterium]|nr:hypothetical protein [Planctomycetaceae bacterium]